MDGNAIKPLRTNCRIKPISGVTLLARCLEADSESCSYAFVIQHGVLCRHPEWQQKMIVEEGE